jgi:3',5'-cyclic AMP phosphodiesterase CpdA
MKLLVISDLHVGPKARAQDFSTAPEDMACRNTPDYLKEFDDLVDKNQLEVTHILIAGDITQSATYEEFELAACNIQKLAKKLNVEKNKIFFVPGNHDGNWNEERMSIANKEPLALSISKKYTNIEQHPFFSNLLDNAQFKDMYKSPFGSIWMDKELVVVGVNSSANDLAINDLHHGLVNLKELDILKSKLSELDTSGKLKVLITHHHPKNLADRTFPENDYSIMQNADYFLRLATEKEFDVIVHGHKHIPRFDIHSDANNFPIVTLSSGSFSASLKDYHNGVGNFFHIIDVEGKCPTNKNILGKVISWAYFDNNGWITADKSRDYISHVEFFGDVRNKSVLKNEFRAEIKTHLLVNDFFRWSSFLVKKPEMKYCNLSLRENAIKETCLEEGWEYCPMKSDGDFMIMKEDL